MFLCTGWWWPLGTLNVTVFFEGRPLFMIAKLAFLSFLFFDANSLLTVFFVFTILIVAFSSVWYSHWLHFNIKHLLHCFSLMGLEMYMITNLEWHSPLLLPFVFIVSMLVTWMLSVVVQYLILIYIHSALDSQKSLCHVYLYPAECCCGGQAPSPSPVPMVWTAVLL